MHIGKVEKIVNEPLPEWFPSEKEHLEDLTPEPKKEVPEEVIETA